MSLHEKITSQAEKTVRAKTEIGNCRMCLQCRLVWLDYGALGGKRQGEDEEGGRGCLVSSSPLHFPVGVQLSGKDC